MEYIRKDPLFKKLVISVLGILIVIYGVFIVFEINQLNKVHKNQIETYQRIVGAVVSKYPESEIKIVEAILNDKESEYQKSGAEILHKYGYSLDMKINSDKSFIDGQGENILKSEFGVLGIVFLVNIGLLIMIFKKVGKYFEYVSDTLENFLKDKYECKECDLNDGVMARVSNQLKQVADTIALKNQRLIEERESSQELVTDISHQLKTPLASLDMCNSILMDESLSEEERVEFLESSRMNINKLKSLIDVLINISRLEAEMIKITKENKSIKATLTKAVNGIYMKALNKNIEIELCEFEDEIIAHDPKWTEEAIFNVIDNGVKYTPEGGHINIEVSKNHNYVRIAIKDDGIGIDKKHFNDIFKRFYRGESKLVKNEEGSGVGLYLARKIIEEQGGSIMVKSKGSLGSEFSILLSRE